MNMNVFSMAVQELYSFSAMAGIGRRSINKLTTACLYFTDYVKTDIRKLFNPITPQKGCLVVIDVKLIVL